MLSQAPTAAVDFMARRRWLARAAPHHQRWVRAPLRSRWPLMRPAPCFRPAAQGIFVPWAPVRAPEFRAQRLLPGAFPEA